MGSGEPVTAAEAIASGRDLSESPAVRVSQAGARVPEPYAIDDDPGSTDLYEVAGNGGEDLENGRGAARAAARGEIRASPAEAGDRQRQAGGDETVPLERQLDGPVEAQGERRGGVDADKAAAQRARHVAQADDQRCQDEDADRAAPFLLWARRRGVFHRKWRTIRTALTRGWR